MSWPGLTSTIQPFPPTSTHYVSSPHRYLFVWIITTIVIQTPELLSNCRPCCPLLLLCLPLTNYSIKHTSNLARRAFRCARLQGVHGLYGRPLLQTILHVPVHVQPPHYVRAQLACHRVVRLHIAQKQFLSTQADVSVASRASGIHSHCYDATVRCPVSCRRATRANAVRAASSAAYSPATTIRSHH